MSARHHSHDVLVDFLGHERRTSTSPLVEAAFRKDHAGLKKLLVERRADPAAPDKEGLSAIMAAVLVGDEPALRMLVLAISPTRRLDAMDAPGALGVAPLFAAARLGHASVVAFLLDAGVDPNRSDSRGRMPISAAPHVWAGAEWGRADGRGSFPLLEAAQNGFEEVVDLLVAAGANVRQKDPSGRAPLHAAAEAGSLKALDALLRAGADPNAGDEAGWAPLALACRAGSAAIVDKLIEAGADPNGPHGPPRREPLEPDQNLGGGARGGPGEAAEAAEAAERSMSPLHAAAAYGHGALVAKLVRAGADPDAPDADGATPLFCAAAAGHEAVVAALSEARADVNKPVHS